MAGTVGKEKNRIKFSSTAVTIVLGVAIFAYLLSLADFFQGLEFRLYDLAFQRRGPRSVEKSDLAVVAIDQPTCDNLPFPFDRKYYSELIIKLNQLGAKFVVFDILFDSEGSRPGSDSLFRKTIAEAGNVILCGQSSRIFQRGLTTPLTSMTAPHPSVLPPGSPWGLIDDFNDMDGVTRRYPLYVTYRDSVYLSLGLKVFALSHGIKGGNIGFAPNGDLLYAGLKIPHSTDASTTFLNYSGPAGTFPTYSFFDVISGAYDFAAMMDTLTDDEKAVLKASGMAGMFDKNPFEGKIVLVGASVDGLHDNKYTPFFSATNPRQTPGVEGHANAIWMFEQQSYIRVVNFWLVLLGVVILSLLTYQTGRHVAHWSGIVLALALMLAVMIGSVLLFNNEHLWLRQIPLLLAVAIGYPTNLLYRFIQSQREKAMIRGMFSQYVPKIYVQQLIKNPDLLKLGGERKRLSMLFTDVAGFTTVSEKLTPEELVSLLNEYLTAMSRVVFENDGIVDKYEGDLVMAEFGAPIWNPNHAAQACRTGLGMQRRLRELREKGKAEGTVQLYSRVGINTGDVIVGNMGSEEKFDYTVMGDAVNLASRLEGANKSYGSTIMIGHNTWLDVKDDFITRSLDLLRVKGKLEPVAVYELLAEKSDELIPAQLQAIEFYKQGMELYRAGAFGEADKMFLNALEADPNDHPAKVYHERCELYVAEPPGEDWDGVWTLMEK